MKTLLTIVAIGVALFVIAWLFNHISPWLGLLFAVIVIAAGIYLAKKQIKNQDRA